MTTQDEIRNLPDTVDGQSKSQDMLPGGDPTDMLIELSLLADLTMAFSGATPGQAMLFVSRKPSNSLQVAAISRNKHSNNIHMQLGPESTL